MAKLSWKETKFVRKAKRKLNYSNLASAKQMVYLNSLSMKLGHRSAASFLEALHSDPAPTKRAARLAISEALTRINAPSPV